MKRSAALKRSGFKKPSVVRVPLPPPVRVERSGTYAGSVVAALPKPVRALPVQADQSRLFGHVASLPCARCWREGRTQVSHSNQSIDGKGRGIKAYPWRVAALCDECHQAIDQGKDMSRAERVEAWNAAHRWTLGELFARGLVRPV